MWNGSLARAPPLVATESSLAVPTAYDALKAAWMDGSVLARSGHVLERELIDGVLEVAVLALELLDVAAQLLVLLEQRLRSGFAR